MSPANAGQATICSAVCPACTPDCTGKQCGDNGCGGTCGTPSATQYCTADGKLGPIPDATTLGGIAFPPAASLPPPDPGDTPGTLEGNFDVTAFGQASYSIPLQLPPGRNGIEPQLALNYDSSAGNGYVGFGWSISGFSAITRCPQTTAQDGAPAPILFDASDRFCLDGRRLVKVSSGNYGADKTEYRTEIDSFSKVVSNGNSTPGQPDSFTVWTRDGRQLTYDIPVLGNEPLAQGVLKAPDYKDTVTSDTRTETWLLSTVQDRLGNKMQIQYWQPRSPLPSSGAPAGWGIIGGRVREYYPIAIYYTSHPSLGSMSDGGRLVKFTYSPRKECLAGYDRGVRFERSQRLDTISASVRGQVDFEYRFVYREPTGTARHLSATEIQKRTLLTSVQQCARASTTTRTSGLTCKDATTFEYEDVQSSFGNEGTGIAARQDASLDDANFLGQPIVLDIDGNGYPDILTPGCTGLCTSTYWSLTLNGSATSEQVNRLVGQIGNILVPATAQVVDIDNDGDDEVLEVDGTTGTVRVWNRTSSLTATTLNLGTPAVTGAIVADVNGDGAPDLVTCSSSSTQATYANRGYDLSTSYTWQRRLNDTTGKFGAAATIGTFSSNCIAASAFDIDGDGADELLMNVSLAYQNSRFDGRSSPTGAVRTYADSSIIWPLTGAVSATGTASEQGSVRVVLDTNGDGLLDIVTFDDDLNIGIWHNTGVGFVHHASSINIAGSNRYSGHKFIDKLAEYGVVIDYNRDGRQDILTPVSDTAWAVLVSVDDGFALDLSFTGGPTGPNHIAVYDSNRDGVQDLGYWKNGSAKYRPGRGHATPLLTAITDGLGARIGIAYSELDRTTADNGSLPYVHGRCSYPLSCRPPAGTAVRRVQLWDTRSFNDSNAVRAFRYAYQSAVVDAKGRGALGFRSRTIVDEVKDSRAKADDSNGGHLVTLTYALVPALNTYIYPYVGMVWTRTEKTSMPTGNPTAIDRVEKSDRTFATINTNTNITNVVYPIVQSQRDTLYDYVRNSDGSQGTGTELKSVTYGWAYDNYGNVTSYGADSWPSPIIVDNVAVDTAFLVDDPNAGRSATYLNKWLISLPASRTISGNGTVSSKETYYYYEDSGGAANLQFTGLPQVIVRDTPAPTLTTTFIHNSLGNVEHVQVSGQTVDGAQMRNTTISYADDQVFPASVTDDDRQHQRKLYYDTGVGTLVATEETGKPTRPTVKTFNIPDGFGRPRSIIGPDGIPTLLTYAKIGTSWGYQASTTHAGSPSGVVKYDLFGRVASAQVDGFSSALLSEVTYDALGGVSTTRRPHESSVVEDPTTVVYDALGRPTKTTYPGGAHDEKCYWENTVCYQNRRGYTSCTQYDEHGNVWRTFDPDATMSAPCLDVARAIVATSPTNTWPNRSTSAPGTRFYYGPFGDLEQVNDSAGDVSVFQRDASRRLLSYNDPDRGQWSYTYNAFGETETQTSPKAEVATLRYDTLGRLVRRTDPFRAPVSGGPVVVTTSWTWDQNFYGALASSTSIDGVRADYAYDDVGRTVGTTESVPSDSGSESMYINQTFDPANGRLDTVTYSSVNGPTLAVKYGYTATGYLGSLKNTSLTTPYWQQTAVDRFGKNASETFANGLVTTRTYKPDTGYPDTIKTTNGIQNSTFATYDSNGNVTTQTIGSPSETTTYSYDPLDRLLTADSKDASSGAATYKETFQYDALGGLTQKTWKINSLAANVQNYTYVPGKPRRLASTAVQGGSTRSYSYDANGNVKNWGTTTFDFSQLEMLQTVTLPSGGKEFLFYDADGERARKRTLTDETYYLGESYYRTRNLGTSGFTEHFVLYAGDRPVTEVIRGASATDTYYLHTDRLGSVEIVSDVSKLAADRRVYQAYGKHRTGPSPQGIISDYATHTLDAELGLINMQARMYDPDSGRFLSPDPLVISAGGSQGLNPYSYVLGNPVNAVDPFGFECDGDGVVCPPPPPPDPNGDGANGDGFWDKVQSDWQGFKSRFKLAWRNFWDPLPKQGTSVAFDARQAPGTAVGNNVTDSTTTEGGGGSSPYPPGISNMSSFAKHFSDPVELVDPTRDADVNLDAINPFLAVKHWADPDISAEQKMVETVLLPLNVIDPAAGAVEEAAVGGASKAGSKYLAVGVGAAARGQLFKHAWISKDLFRDLQRLVGKADFLKFKAALQKGVVGPTGESGVKILATPVRGFTHELKIGGSAQRLLGRIDQNDVLVFEEFVRGGLH